MAAQTSTSTAVARETEKTTNNQLLVVDLGKRQSAKRIKQLRNGGGKLMPRIQTIVSELVDNGTLKADAQPVVIIVREEPRLPWMFD